MRILSRACARFDHPADRSVSFHIKPPQRLVLMDAPEWLADVRLFQLMVEDGTIQVVKVKEQQKVLEIDPIQGATPEGKMVASEQPSDSVQADKPKRTRRKAAEPKE